MPEGKKIIKRKIKSKQNNLSQKEIDSYAHKGVKRVNNPPVGLVSSSTDKLNGRTKYSHDPHIDPYLSWAGKAEGLSFEVQNVSLHVHERIDSKRIIQAFLKRKEKPHEIQLSLFDEPDNEPPLHKAIDFYRHEQDWTNRLIAGDSLLVMNSLLRKEGMTGKVQMIYIDPPYGIKYNSNFQPFINKRDVKDGNDGDIPAEPEMIQAFRDTWELGVHSYLTYLRNRLLLAKELLHESGSCFVQISDENVHHVREIMNEIFGNTNFIQEIPFRKTVGATTSLLATVNDYLIWYAKDKSKVKFRKLFRDKNIETSDKKFSWYEISPGELVSLENYDGDLSPSKIIALDDLTSQEATRLGSFKITFLKQEFIPPTNRHWRTTQDGINVLITKNRLYARNGKIFYKRYLSDQPVSEFNNFWFDTVNSFEQKIYVVQTNQLVVQRCMLMATDPGDLVFDPTCGSGTTAYVAEQWGRRWITCDTSRVATTLAKQRLMTAKFDYYDLAHPNEGVRSGFKYKTVPHITLGSIANNEPAKEETLYDKPFVEKNKVRVTGPFTVEAVPSLRVKPFDGKEPKMEVKGNELARMGETGNQALWRDELKATGIRTIGGKIIPFSRVEPMVATRFLHAEGEILEDGTTKKAYISFGPDYGALEQRQIEEALKEARSLKIKPDFVVFAAFHFDPEAAKDVDQIEWKGVTILKAQMSVDLLTQDLRKKRSSNQSYWLIGQPDVEVKKIKDGQYKVIVHGFDYYDPLTGEIRSESNKQIAMWFLDTDYNERSLMPDQVFFPMADDNRGWTKLAKALNGEVDEDLLETFRGTESLPFEPGNNRKIAVKIIDNRGIESFVIKKLE